MTHSETLKLRTDANIKAALLGHTMGVWYSVDGNNNKLLWMESKCEKCNLMLVLHDDSKGHLWWKRGGWKVSGLPFLIGCPIKGG